MTKQKFKHRKIIQEFNGKSRKNSGKILVKKIKQGPVKPTKDGQ